MIKKSSNPNALENIKGITKSQKETIYLKILENPINKLNHNNRVLSRK